MKVMTVLGTRPEIIRLSQIIPKLDALCDHIVVHTGQNYATTLSDIFFADLTLRTPDHSLHVRGETFGSQVAQILSGVERLLIDERPDRLLVLGDTNSGLAAVIAKRMGIPVYHMEAGNRCYDDRVPEEVNRRIIDHCSSVLMPYTHRSAANLVREGVDRSRVFVIGNPIYEVLQAHKDAIDASNMHERLGLKRREYFVVTMHRAENVDHEDRLRQLVESLQLLSQRYGWPVVCSLHPRTRSRMTAFGLNTEGGIRFIEPLGFFDFAALESHAACALSDSGTVQEECCIFGVPNVTIRDVTERPETIEAGSNVLTGMEPARVVSSVALVMSQPTEWLPPPEYVDPLVSPKVLRIVLGYDWREEQ